ncbi:MAG: hypothetical protein Tsb002_27460 [Wenzhouxiangellaceae bacterium]
MTIGTDSQHYCVIGLTDPIALTAGLWRYHSNIPEQLSLWLFCYLPVNADTTLFSILGYSAQ